MTKVLSIVMIVLLQIEMSNAFAQENLASRLRFFSLNQKRNYEKLDKWSSEYEVFDSYPLESPEGVVNISTVARWKFEFDSQERRVLTELRGDPKRIKILKQGKLIDSKNFAPVDIKFLRTPTDQVMMRGALVGPGSNDASDPGHVTGAPSRLAMKSPLTPVVLANSTDALIDPRECFYVQNTLVWDLLGGYSDTLEGKFGSDEARRAEELTELVMEDTKQVVLRLGFVDGMYKKVRSCDIALSKADGYLPVSSRLVESSGVTSEEKKWTWRKAKETGVLVPEAMTFTFLNESGGLVLERTFKFRSVKIGVELQSDLYSDQLRMAKGDRMKDVVKSEFYVHDGTKLVSTRGTERWLDWKSLLGACVIACFVFVYVSYVRRKAKR